MGASQGSWGNSLSLHHLQMNPGGGQALVGGVSLKLTKTEHFGNCKPRSLDLGQWRKGCRWRQGKVSKEMAE